MCILTCMACASHVHAQVSFPALSSDQLKKLLDEASGSLEQAIRLGQSRGFS